MDMYKLKSMLCEELTKYEKRDNLSMGDLEVIHKLTDTIKNIDKIDSLEDYSGWSNGQHYVRGHYSRDYSGDVRQSLSRMAYEARDDRERDMARRFLHELDG